MPQLSEELAAAIDDDDVYRLEKAVQEFRRGHLKDEDLLAKAYTRLCHLHRACESLSVCLSVCLLLSLSLSPLSLSYSLSHPLSLRLSNSLSLTLSLTLAFLIVCYCVCCLSE